MNNLSTREKIKKLSISALLAALCFIGTLIIQIPIGAGGYIHIGDCFVLICGYMLGPVYGSIAAAIGSGLTDLVSGWIPWVPATFVVKGLVALTAYFVFIAFFKITKRKFSSFIIASIIAELLMVVGYALYTALFFGGIAEGLASIPANLIQGASGVVLSTILAQIFANNNTLLRIAPMEALGKTPINKQERKKQ